MPARVGDGRAMLCHALATGLSRGDGVDGRMTADQDQVLAELPLPLSPDADPHAVLELAIAIEDGCGVILPDEAITVAHLGTHRSITALLRSLAERA